MIKAFPLLSALAFVLLPSCAEPAAPAVAQAAPATAPVKAKPEVAKVQRHESWEAQSGM